MKENQRFSKRQTRYHFHLHPYMDEKILHPYLLILIASFYSYDYVEIIVPLLIQSHDHFNSIFDDVNYHQTLNLLVNHFDCRSQRYYHFIAKILILPLHQFS